MKKYLCLLFSLCLCMFLCVPTFASGYEESSPEELAALLPDASSPQETFNAYLDGLERTDLSQEEFWAFLEAIGARVQGMSGDEMNEIISKIAAWDMARNAS